MLSSTHLLNRAYHLIEENRFSSAMAILDSLVFADPGNVEAWEALMQLSETRKDVERIVERAQSVKELDREGRKSIGDYSIFLIRGFEKKGVRRHSEEKVVFHLVDQFDHLVPDQMAGHLDPARVDEKSTSVRSWPFRILLTILLVWLLVLGSRLISNGILFGYWLLLGFVVGAVINLWSLAVRHLDTKSASHAYRSNTIDAPVLITREPIIIVGPDRDFEMNLNFEDQ